MEKHLATANERKKDFDVANTGKSASQKVVEQATTGNTRTNENIEKEATHKSITTQTKFENMGDYNKIKAQAHALGLDEAFDTISSVNLAEATAETTAKIYGSSRQSRDMMSLVSGGVVDEDMLKRVAAGNGSVDDNVAVSFAAAKTKKAIQTGSINGNKLTVGMDTDGHIGYVSQDGSQTVDISKNFRASISGAIAGINADGVNMSTMPSGEVFDRYAVQSGADFLGGIGKSFFSKGAGKVQNRLKALGRKEGMKPQKPAENGSGGRNR